MHEVLKFVSNIESLFSFNFQVKKTQRPNFAFWGTFKLMLLTANIFEGGPMPANLMKFFSRVAMGTKL